jgi:hypothetical protein
MGLKDRLKSGALPEGVPAGFELPKPVTQHFTNLDSFCKAAKEQADATVMLEALPVNDIGMDGSIIGTDYRLSYAAFSDLCHYADIPVRFIKSLAKQNEELTLAVVHERLLREFLHPERMLVIDTRDNTILGIVSKGKYSPITHMDVLDYAFTANPDLTFTNGWLNGPVMRAVATAESGIVTPRKDDVVKVGVNLENAVHGDRSVRVCDYAERLKCTNGLVARDAQHMSEIRHVGDVSHNVAQAVVDAAGRAQDMAPLMHAATSKLLDLDTIRSVRSFVANDKRFGGKSLSEAMKNAAMLEAKDEGRDATELTLWNFVNGITQAAHSTPSLKRKTEIESLGYRTLAKYGVALAKN